MKANAPLERYYVLPACLLLLNLCNEIIVYKSRLIGDNLLRTFFIMGLVLFGASVMAYAVAPGIIWGVQSMRRTSRTHGGGLGEALALLLLGTLIFWLYYRVYVLGVEFVLLAEWRNQ